MERSIADLLILQNLCKRDPRSYQPEFQEQLRHFKAAYDLFRLKPAKDHKEFASLVKFLAAVSTCYPQDLKEFPTQIAELLEQNANVLHPDLRKVLVQALILLRNRNLLSPTSLLSLFFKLFRVRDKVLRVLLRSHIVNDIKRLNAKKVNNELNRTLQNFMYTMLEDDSSIAPRESLGVMIELYRKAIWKDEKTVNVIATGAFHKDSKVIAMTLQFFLVNKKAKVVGQDSDEEEEEEYVPNRREVEHKFGLQHKRKTRARKRKLAKELKEANHKRKEKLRKEVDDEANYNLGAMNLLHDPQGYAEKVLNALRKSNHAFELKIRMMSFISRLIASQKLLVPSFYSYMIKYTQPHQQHITQLLSVLAQGVHTLVPPDDIEPVIKHIANTFVTDRRPNEVISIVLLCHATLNLFGARYTLLHPKPFFLWSELLSSGGLNTIREICLRSPLAMEGHEALLKDLIGYRKYKDKGVMMAARSLLTLFRTVNPSLLPRKMRGRGIDATYKPTYGEEVEVQKGIEGTELLEKYGDKLDLDNLSDSDSFFSSEISEEFNSAEMSGSDDGEEAESDEAEEDEADEAEGDEAEDGAVEDSDDEGDELEFIEDADEVDFADLEKLRKAQSQREAKTKAKAAPAPPKKKAKVVEESEDDSGDESGSEDEWEEVDPAEAKVPKRSAPSDGEDEDGESGSEDEWESLDTDELSEGDLEDDDEDDEEDGDGAQEGDEDSDNPPQLIPIETKKRLETTKILTDEDWEKLRYLRDREDLKDVAGSRKRKLQEMIDRDLDPEDLEGWKKKARRTLEERLESVKAGRDEQKRKFEFGRKRVGGSKTNDEKRKTKNFSMVRAKALMKLRRSGQQKLRVKKKHLTKLKSQRMNKHH